MAGAYSACEEALRNGASADRDAWLASLFIPAAARGHVQALYAFSMEIARIPDIVSQPALGEIRLQWWIEAIEGSREGEALSHPVCAALLDTVKRFNLPREALAALVEARRFDLYADPMPSVNDLEGYCGETHGCLIRLASIALAGGRDPGGAEAAGYSGVAIGIARILAGMPAQAARSQCFIPIDLLGRHGASPDAVAAGLMSSSLEAALVEMRDLARRNLASALRSAADMEPVARAALLPLALVEPILRGMERRSYNPFRDNAEPAQWRRQWALWRASRKL
jgi:phytoene synthase